MPRISLARVNAEGLWQLTLPWDPDTPPIVVYGESLSKALERLARDVRQQEQADTLEAQRQSWPPTLRKDTGS